MKERKGQKRKRRIRGKREVGRKGERRGTDRGKKHYGKQKQWEIKGEKGEGIKREKERRRERKWEAVVDLEAQKIPGCEGRPILKMCKVIADLLLSSSLTF